MLDLKPTFGPHIQARIEALVYYPIFPLLDKVILIVETVKPGMVARLSQSSLTKFLFPHRLRRESR
jgi:hypothetical protein